MIIFCIFVISQFYVSSLAHSSVEDTKFILRTSNHIFVANERACYHCIMKPYLQLISHIINFQLQVRKLRSHNAMLVLTGLVLHKKR